MSEKIRRIAVCGVEYPIEAESVVDGAITNKKIEDKAINANKIMDRAITAEKISYNAIHDINIVDGAVSTKKILNASVTKEKLDSEVRDAISGYHDDGSGNLVPVKHPNLSTQPSILPYKVGGSYVYEQLICLSEARCSDDADYTDKVSCEIPWDAEVENPRILCASFFTSCAEYPNANIPVIVHYYGGRIIALVDRIALARAASLPLEDGTMPTGWLRIVYSEFRDTGSNYYYSYQGEEKLGELHIVYDTENYDNTLALALYEGRTNDGILVYGDIISQCDVDVPKGVRLHGEYLQKFLYEGLTLVLLADTTIYGLCKGATYVSCGTGEPFVCDVSYPGPFANLYGLDIEYALRHGETVVLRINSTDS